VINQQLLLELDMALKEDLVVLQEDQLLSPIEDKETNQLVPQEQVGEKAGGRERGKERGREGGREGGREEDLQLLHSVFLHLLLLLFFILMISSEEREEGEEGEEGGRSATPPLGLSDDYFSIENKIFLLYFTETTQKRQKQQKQHRNARNVRNNTETSKTTETA